MKYLLIVTLIVIAGCKSAEQIAHERAKYPNCLNYAPKPDKPFEERLQHPYWRDAQHNILAKMQTINVTYGKGSGLKYLNFLYKRGNISKDDYEWIKKDYNHYMPRR